VGERSRPFGRRRASAAVEKLAELGEPVVETGAAAQAANRIKSRKQEQEARLQAIINEMRNNQTTDSNN
jgi:hypothetical protein